MIRKPVEKQPTGIRVPAFWYAQHSDGVIPYRPRDNRPRDKPVQEDWESVARQFGVNVSYLIFFNFLTNDPAEVNWYLHRNVGCNKISPSGNNWMFSNSANPGIIYIPPAQDRKINFAPEEYCSWTPNQTTLFIQRLRVIAQSISGPKGERIKKLVKVILRVGYPRCLDLWYYNDMNIEAYVDWRTPSSKIREMTKATDGAFPFNGPSGLYSQSLDEQGRGMWRIHAVKDLFDQYACGTWDAQDLKSELESIDEQMFSGWHRMVLAQGRVGLGGGSVYQSEVEQFIHHVNLLTEDDGNLYAAFSQ